MSSHATRALRDIAIVAGNELGEALRSRRVLILALLFVGGSVAGTLVFIDVLQSVETSVASALNVTHAGKPGAMTGTLMHSEQFVQMLGNLIHDERLARELSSLPPLALFYGWLGLTFMPVMVMLSATEAISSELASGSARFSLLRTSRLCFSAGKLVGQSLLVLTAIACGALAVWITGFVSLSSFDPAGTALWLLLLSLRIGVFAFAYVGLALGISHLTRSVPLSRALGLASLLALAMLSGLLEHAAVVRRYAPDVADAVLVLLPRTHMLDLWQPHIADRLPSIVMLSALGIVYFALGYRFRARRDA